MPYLRGGMANVAMRCLPGRGTIVPSVLLAQGALGDCKLDTLVKVTVSTRTRDMKLIS